MRRNTSSQPPMIATAGRDLNMKGYSAFALVPSFALLGATEARACTVTFTIGEEDGWPMTSAP